MWPQAWERFWTVVLSDKTLLVPYVRRPWSCCLCRWGQTTSLNCGLQRAWFSFPRWSWSSGGMILAGKIEELGGKKPVPVPLCPPQFPHGLIRAGTLTSAVRGRRITAWVIARPRLWSWSSLCRLLNFVRGRAMAQVVGRRPFAVKSLVSSCGICGRQSGTERGFSPPSSDFPHQYHATGAPCSYIIWRMNNRSVGDCSSETVSPRPHEQHFVRVLPAL
jgi:hypothetical protein